MPYARIAACLTAFGLMACTVDLDLSEEAAQAVREQSLGDYPYHPMVFQLDLSILAYQLYGQSLVWPFDPYYEELDRIDDARPAFIDTVQRWAQTRGDIQAASPLGLAAYRGPGVLSGFANNASHDPILYQYSRLHPWSESITNDVGKWIEYRTPRTLTDPIASVFVCTRTAGQPEGHVTVDPLLPARNDTVPGGRDVLMVFEGGTGDKGEPGQPVSQSLMGLALLRFTPDGDTHLHIAFRGSRSGNATRAALEAVSTDMPSGNPDWITDLGVRPIDVPLISGEGQVTRGVARTVQTVLPTLFGCLDHVAQQPSIPPPKLITVTGHSLGGAIAQQFSSAVVLGSDYAQGGAALPDAVSDWPWRNLKLVTFGAPRVGTATWAAALSAELDSAYFAARYTYDYEALGLTDPSLLPRMNNADRPAAYRVLMPDDPITNSYLIGGSHLGTTVYLALPRDNTVPSTEHHDPVVIRQFMVDTLRDPERVPAEAWRSVPLHIWSPSRNAGNTGTRSEYVKLIDATHAYYNERDLWFDHAALEQSAATFLDLLKE